MGEAKGIEEFEKHYAEGRLILKDVLPLNLPLCISLEASNLCNFRCVMCCHGNEEYVRTLGKQKNMDWEMFDRCVSQMENWCGETGKKIKLVKLYSLGEPLIHPQICDMVKRIKESDICETLEITSNASLLNEETGRKLVDNGLDIFRASVYSIDEERNKRITKSSFSPREIAENIQKMRTYRDSRKQTTPFISAKMMDSYSDENDRFLQMYSAIADEAYIDKIMVFDENTLQDYYGEKVELAGEDPDRIKIAGVRRACRYPFTHMTVRSDGQVVVCCADWKQMMVVGDVNKIHCLKFGLPRNCMIFGA